MPVKLEDSVSGQGEYDIYPVCSLGENAIFNGYHSLARWITEQKTVRMDGYAGLFWKEIQGKLDQYFAREGLTVNWIKTESFLKPVPVVDQLVQPFLGTPDSVWGTRCTLSLEDLYEMEALSQLTLDENTDLNIVIGTGAALVNWDAPLVYIDLPKNELQFRMRAGAITNLGADQPAESTAMYKRFYFVDWVLLNAHKKAILNDIAVIADGQWPSDINWMHQTSLAAGLDRMSRSVIRVRPWFEPGAWGGQWIKQNIPHLNQDVVNYAWSFEMIVPENGLVFESDGYLLEVSFDFLMFHANRAVLGKHAEQFGDEFPIRFDFLDTYEGGNLSIQCHPSLPYIREQFGEQITQDETYYILDATPDARVYLGFQETIQPAEFRRVLEESQSEGKAIAIEQYVQVHPAPKHALFLIPNGTVHSAGAGNLVLEISATPYIFTFKMYDWLRLDLEGKPRPINIDHAFRNLNFERKGDRVRQELMAQPVVIDQGPDWQLVHLPTHPQHFYDVHRIELDTQVAVQTQNVCHIMMLVEGESVRLETLDGTERVFAFAETFVVPAAAQTYRLTNLGKGRAKVIKAFLK
jgi:mannose-6-phosphate isomerase class I